ncbi:hypothetical protein PR048_031807 [Dryococelus australis]|uniref:Uncharacterized protein n=1 Tax=Dryococelus australis TaxID=614101 RepID=A0ABQ9G6C1_9NEOP|nr:hypothetical protein PR048_031807 [Dryococelus australis]
MFDVNGDMYVAASQRAARFKDQLQRKLEERSKVRQRGKVAGVSKLVGLKMKGANSCAGPSSAPMLPNKPSVFRPMPQLVPLATANLIGEAMCKR